MIETPLAIEVGGALLMFMILVAGAIVSWAFPKHPEMSIFLLALGLAFFFGQVIWLTGRIKPGLMNRGWWSKWLWGVITASVFMFTVWAGSYLTASSLLNDDGADVLRPIAEEKGLTSMLGGDDINTKDAEKKAGSDTPTMKAAELELYRAMLGGLEDPQALKAEKEIPERSELKKTPKDLYDTEAENGKSPVGILQGAIDAATGLDSTATDGTTSGEQLAAKLLQPMAIPGWASPAPTAKAAILELDYKQKEQKWRADVAANIAKHDRPLLIAQAYYEALKKRVGEVERARNRFFGLIQFMTLLFSFVALVTLAGHRGRLDRELKQALSVLDEIPGKLSRITIRGDVKAREIRNQVGYVLSQWKLATSWARSLMWRMLEVVRDRVSMTAQVPVLLLEQMEHAAEKEAKACLEESRRDNFHFFTFAFWFVPISGLIGTVVGFGRAMGGTDAVFRTTEASARTGAVSAVVTELAVAFDTTFVALCAIVPLFMLAHKLKQSESTNIKRIARSLTDKVEATCFAADNEPAN